ncbi:pentapeptide repeat-containing protein [Arachidicoccus soli]|uniref:Pentapeptide repeat-containing protein n=1 Tax=Arachidicoccus soli TaxID=2341117 RepID=A0A386HR99_9BACT|nr:pentapeptide repeat-containing protein [Arachidicoccus soli]AYD48179.1 pentapeptide repeat-containing protein [Arachidicoccus soli]
MTEEIIFERENQLRQDEYVRCAFINCNFSEEHFSNFRFENCRFIDCNLHMLKVVNTLFSDIDFKGSKMNGIKFETANPFVSFSFDNCLLNHSSFYKMKLRELKFVNCSLKGVDFTQADLKGVDFDNSDLLDALFDKTILENADLRTAINFAIDPSNNKVAKAKFSNSNLAGLLTKYNIKIEQ